MGPIESLAVGRSALRPPPFMPLLPCAGKLPIRTGIYTNTSFPLDDLYRVFLPASVGCLPENETTFATPFKNAGYYTALGAW